MEQSKYYTPTIEEFHVGFEFEVKIADSKEEWVKEVYKYPHDWFFNITDDGCMKKLADPAVPDCIRVKYLDGQDIEDLGWGGIGKMKNTLSIWGK